MIRSVKVFCLVGSLLGLGCTGAIRPSRNATGDEPGQPGGAGQPSGGAPSIPTPGVPNSGGPAAKPGAGALSDGNAVPGPAPLRRLTRFEYENTLRDLLGV